MPGPYYPAEGSIEQKVMTGENDFAGSYQILGFTNWFTFPIDNPTMYYYSRYPVPLAQSWNNITGVFRWDSWAATVITLTVYSLGLLIAYTCYSRLLRGRNLLNARSKPKGGCDFVLLPFFATNEPLSVDWFSSKSASGSTLSAVWRLLCLLIPVMFSSNLRAQMIKPAYERPVETYQDMLRRGQNIWIPHYVDNPDEPWNVTQYQLYMIRADIRAYVIERNTTFAQEWVDGYEVLIPQRVMDDVSNNGASLLYFENVETDTGVITPRVRRQFDDLRRSRQTGTETARQRVFYVRRESPWRADFDSWIIRMRAAGIMEYLKFRVKRKYRMRRRTASGGINQQKNRSKLEIKHFYFMLTIWSAGLLISLVTVIVETRFSGNNFLGQL